MGKVKTTPAKDRPKSQANEEAEARRAVGRFLQKSRLAASLSQREVAARLGYTTPQFVSNWERGLSLPPLRTLPELASLLKVPPAAMIEAIHDYQVAMARIWLQRVEAQVAVSAIDPGTARA